MHAITNRGRDEMGEAAFSKATCFCRYIRTARASRYPFSSTVKTLAGDTATVPNDYGVRNIVTTVQRQCFRRPWEVDINVFNSNHV